MDRVIRRPIAYAGREIQYLTEFGISRGLHTHSLTDQGLLLIYVLWTLAKLSTK